MTAKFNLHRINEYIQKRKIMKLFTLIIILTFTASCSSEKSQSQTNSLTQSGKFMLEIPNGKNFTHDSKKFKIINATIDYFEFESFGWQTRFSASKLDESSPSSSTDMIYNNTFVSFYENINSKRTKIMCKPARDPKGEIKITAIENNTFSGEFEFELVKCNTFYGSENVTAIKVPFLAKGTFEKLGYENHLEKLINKK